MPQNYLNALTRRIYWSPPDSDRDRPVMGAVMGRHNTLIVETGASPAHANQFRNALLELEGPPPHFAAVTHWHWDHVFGTSTLGLPTIGHVETRHRVLEMARLDWRDNALNARVASGQELAFIADHVKVELTSAERGMLVITAPDIVFTDALELDLGGLTARVMHVGGDHSPDSSVVWVPEEKVVFLGDCFYHGFVGEEFFLTQGRLLPLLDTLEGLPAEWYVLSHHPEPLPRADFLREAALMRSICAVVGQTGADREAGLARLADPTDEDQTFLLDSFIRGLKSDVAK